MPRTIVIGDIHGCRDELEDLLADLAPDPGDRLCFLGDLVDRGPDSLGVLRRVRELLHAFPGSVCLMGNHEAKALRRRARGQDRPGWAQEATPSDWAFLEGLPLIHRLRDHGAILVHGGFFPRYFEHYGPLQDIPADWRTAPGKQADRLRRFLFVRQVGPDGELADPAGAPADCVHWTDAYHGSEGFAFFGHDPQLAPPEPLRASHALGLDTGACFGGRLTAAVLSDGAPAHAFALVSVPARRMYATPRLGVD